MDRFNSGKIPTQMLSSFLMHATNQAVSESELRFLASQYVDNFNPEQINYQKFHDDFKQCKRDKGIMSQSQVKINPGSRNPLIPNQTKHNTRTEMSGAMPPIGFRMGIQPAFMEEIMKATYMKEKLVEDYFEGYAA